MMSSEPAAPIPAQPSPPSVRKTPRAPLVWVGLFAAVATLGFWATRSSPKPLLISPAGAAEQKEDRADKPSKKEAKQAPKKESEKKKDEPAEIENPMSPSRRSRGCEMRPSDSFDRRPCGTLSRRQFLGAAGVGCLSLLPGVWNAVEDKSNDEKLPPPKYTVQADPAKRRVFGVRC